MPLPWIGIHQHGVLNYRATVGNNDSGISRLKDNLLVLGKHSGHMPLKKESKSWVIVI